ncbi:MAG: HAD family hydrolase [Candidatus Binatia bacterium]|nr:HAD family hydrolase [Candidatus Binatia bacterium]
MRIRKGSSHELPPVGLRAVVLDCDGVLFDSWSANLAYYNAILRDLGYPPMTPELAELAHRGSSAQFFAHVFQGDEEKIARAKEVAAATDYEPFYRLMRPVPSLHRVLQTLRARYRLAMATNRGYTAQEIVRRFGLTEYLETTVGVRDVERPKPYPDMLLLCLQRLGVEAHEAVYVGDAESDWQAAQAAGMHFVALGGIAVPAPRIQTLEELPAVVEELARHAGRQRLRNDEAVRAR